MATQQLSRSIKKQIKHKSAKLSTQVADMTQILLNNIRYLAHSTSNDSGPLILEIGPSSDQTAINNKNCMQFYQAQKMQIFMHARFLIKCIYL